MSAPLADLHRLRLLSTVASMSAALAYIATGQREPLVLVALITWNLTCLGLYRWPTK
jgi:hypothetical protein